MVTQKWGSVNKNFPSSMQINCKNGRMLVKWGNFGERGLFFEKGFDILKKTKL
jgi:hypothetical protein